MVTPGGTYSEGLLKFCLCRTHFNLLSLFSEKSYCFGTSPELELKISKMLSAAD